MSVARFARFGSAAVLVGALATVVLADPPVSRTPHEPLSLSQAPEPAPADKSAPAHNGEMTANAPESESHSGYREVSDFFNIREANPQVDKGEFEFELEGRWFTRSLHERDELGLAQTLKYGFTDDFFVELEVVEPRLGDGGNQGTGDINLVFFNRFLREDGTWPAIGGQVELRLPSGDGSSGVDATFSAIVTKSITDRLRANVEGQVETANGAPGAEEEDERRHFQWAIGAGIDYLFDDQTLGLLNYINRASEEEGQHNNNILELGVVREIYHVGNVHQHLKFAVDVGLDGQPETPNLGAKFQYSIDWK
ncbi:MAG: hypothetical protein U1A27_10710 [Phycisphaerae bacterium]